MTLKYLALVSDTEAWNPATHQRWDLGAFDVSIEQRESELAAARITVINPQNSLSSLDGRRVLISTKRRLLFDGILTGVPRGLVGQSLTLEAVARPADPAVLDAQLAALAETTKVAPFWDPLFVPQGRENDWAEILAGRSQVLAHSRIQGVPTLCDALGGSSLMEVHPLANSVSYSLESNVAPRYGCKLTVKWKQLASQRFTDGGAFWDLETFTADGLVEDFPKVGTTIGDGFTVVRSRMVNTDKQRGEYEIEWATSEEELDPVWLDQENQTTVFPLYRMNGDIEIEYRWEVARSETATLSVAALAQPGVIAQSEEWEEMELRELTAAESRRPWLPNTDYEVDDEVVDGRNVYRCRVAHKSGRTRTAVEWSLVGQSEYITSRETISFFKGTRGAAAVAHALERIKSRARMAARSVRVSFEVPMPARPWQVTHDMKIALYSSKLPGGFAVGRLVEYNLSWSNGRNTFSGTIACAAGQTNADDPVIGEAVGVTPQSFGRVEITVENDGDAQMAFFEQNAPTGTPVTGSLDIPITTIKIETTPAAATSFEQAVTFPISGSVGIPIQVQT